MSKKEIREDAGVAQRLRLKTIELCFREAARIGFCRTIIISSLKILPEIAEPELDFRVIDFYELPEKHARSLNFGASVSLQAKKGATQFQFL